MAFTVLALLAHSALGRICSTCIAPKHSWKTIPVSFHSSSVTTGPTGAFSDEDVEIIKRFPLVTIEKWQGSQAIDSSGQFLFLWEEDAMIASARKLKAANSNISIVVWFDTLLVYTGWNVDTNNKTVNTTLNPDANKECATGHFRDAEYLYREGHDLLLKNSSGQFALTSFGHCHAYDHSQAAARQYWTDMCLNMTDSGVVDGCGADFSATGTNRWVDHTPTKIAADMGLDIKTATAWASGHRQMMQDTQAALGKGLLVGKDGAELGDHVNGVIQENACYKRNSTVNNLRNLTARARAAGPASKAWVFQCHGQANDHDTLAAFLVGAGNGHFLTTGGWNGGAAGHWSSDFERPLGEPLADAVYNGTAWSRSFKSGTRVTFTPHTNSQGKDMGGTGTIAWGGEHAIESH